MAVILPFNSPTIYVSLLQTYSSSELSCKNIEQKTPAHLKELICEINPPLLFYYYKYIDTNIMMEFMLDQLNPITGGFPDPVLCPLVSAL